MFYRLLAILLVIAGLVWIGADQSTILIVGTLLAINNILAWMINFAFNSEPTKPTYYVEEGKQNPFSY
ncbi:hypothetical protein [Kaarinaea lacus]